MAYICAESYEIRECSVAGCEEQPIIKIKCSTLDIELCRFCAEVAEEILVELVDK